MHFLNGQRAIYQSRMGATAGLLLVVLESCLVYRPCPRTPRQSLPLRTSTDSSPSQLPPHTPPQTPGTPTHLDRPLLPHSSTLPAHLYPAQLNPPCTPLQTPSPRTSTQAPFHTALQTFPSRTSPRETLDILGESWTSILGFVGDVF